jgi:hypothetical protein
MRLIRVIDNPGQNLTNLIIPIRSINHRNRNEATGACCTSLVVGAEPPSQPNPRAATTPNARGHLMRNHKRHESSDRVRRGWTERRTPKSKTWSGAYTGATATGQ